MNKSDYKDVVPLHLAPKLDRKIVKDMMECLLQAGKAAFLVLTGRRRCKFEGRGGYVGVAPCCQPLCLVGRHHAAEGVLHSRQCSTRPPGQAPNGSHAETAAVVYDSDEMDALLDAQEAAWNQE